MTNETSKRSHAARQVARILFRRDSRLKKPVSRWNPTEVDIVLDKLDGAQEYARQSERWNDARYFHRCWMRVMRSWQASRVRLPASRPDPLCQVLNEGDGSYRP